MNAYPIGNDLTVKWSLLYSDGSVFPLSNYDYELSYRTNRGNKVVTDTSVISVDENILTWTFKGDEQVVSGRYTICLKITLSGSKVVELQYDNAFMLSPLSGFKGAGSEIVLQSYCDAIDLKDAVLQARKAMDIAGSAVNTAGGAETTANEAKTIASTANNTSTEAKTIANNAKTVADQAKVTADATAATATQKAEEVAQKEAQLEATLNNLSTDQSGALALSTKVNEHGEKLSELEREINGNVFDLGGYWKYKPIIEQGNFSKYGIIGQTEGWWRMVLPVNFKNATKFKVTPTSNSVTYQFVYLLTNAYPTATSDASRPVYNIITGEETEFDLNDVVYVALCWRDNNNLGATMEDALKMVSINVHSTLADANKVNSLWNKNSVITGKNLFDMSKQVVGYLDASGNLINDNNYRTSDLMPVAGLSNIVISNSAQNGLRNLQTAIIHSFDKNGKWKARLSSGASSISIPSNTAYIRISYRYYSTWDMAVQVESGTSPTEYERYYTLNQLDDSVFRHNVNLEKEPSKLQIVCWGDSLTYGQGGTNYQYPSKLRDYLPNAEIKNFGIPGEKSMAIACRQGAYPVIADPFSIPTSGSVSITIKDVNGNSFATLKHNSMRDLDIYKECIAGINGVLGYSGGNYIFTRAFEGDAISVDRPATFKMYGTHFREWLPIIWAGTNDAPTPENAEEIIKIIEGMVKYSNSDKFLVIGLTHQGTLPTFKDAFNKMLGAKFGIHFINLLEYLKNYGLSDNGLTPTEQDTIDIANNLVPTSLRSDSVHFNDYGYIATAKCVYLKGKDLGYWE